MAVSSYLINFTSPPSEPTLTGKTPFIILPGQIDGPDRLESLPPQPDKAHTSLSLPGEGALRYAEKINENLVRLLENFAAPTPPILGTIGQLWFDSANNVIKVYDVNQDWGFVSSGTQLYEFNIVSADDITDVFVVEGDATEQLVPGAEFQVTGTPSNDGTYIVLPTPTYNAVLDQTTVSVASVPVAQLGPGPGTVIITPAPLAPSIGQLWFNILNQQLYVWNGSAWLNVLNYDPNVGAFDAESQRISNVDVPINPQDAATKAYVDSGVGPVAGKVAKAGDTMTGDLVLFGGAPATSASATPKSYVDNLVSLASLQSTLNPVYVNVSGDTTTGFLILNADPVNPLGAVTKQYVDAAAASSSPAGAIIMFAGAVAPSGWLMCDGSSKVAATYPVLFTAIGYTWGGAGPNFNVPNFNGRSPVGAGLGNTAEGGGSGTSRSLTASGGAETHTLTTPQIPAHTHGYSRYGGLFTADAADDVINTWSGVATIQTSSAGGGGSHNNMHPFLTVNFIIKT
jgi:microcystin-dependent protein